MVSILHKGAWLLLDRRRVFPGFNNWPKIPIPLDVHNNYWLYTKRNVFKVQAVSSSRFTWGAETVKSSKQV